MSVTFTPDLGPIDHYIVRCLNCAVEHDERFDTEDAALAFLRSVSEGTASVTGCQPGDEDCREAACVQAREALGQMPSLNIANGNAVDVLDTLGLPSDGSLCGTIDAQDFMGRVLTGLAVAPESAEIPAHATVGAPHVIRAYREPGYVQRVLTELHEIAQFATDHNRQIVWA